MPVYIALLYGRGGRMQAIAVADPMVIRMGLLDEVRNARLSIAGFSHPLCVVTGPTRDETGLARAAARLREISGLESRSFASIRDLIGPVNAGRAG